MAHERKSTSLFDSDSSSSYSEKSFDDDMTTFTVSSVLEKRGKPSDRSRRDTITRTMPTISINDKYAMPTTVEREKASHYLRDERLQLRATASLMDDSSDSEYDRDELGGDSKTHSSRISSENRLGVDTIFRTPSHDGQPVSSTKSTAVRRNVAAVDPSKGANVLDTKFDNVETDTNTSSDHTIPIHKSDTFMSVYEDLSVNRRVPSKKHGKTRYSDFTGRGTQVKTLVTTTFKSVADGLAASNACDGAGSWDVDEIERLSGKKRPIEVDKRIDVGRRQRNQRKSLNVRAELMLMQDAVQAKREECDALKRQIAGLKNENSFAVQSKGILESKLGVAREARQVAETNCSVARENVGAANARVESLSHQLRESQSEVEGLRLGIRQKNDEVHNVRCQLQQTEYELEKMKREKKDVERERESKKSNAELQAELDIMCNSLKEIRELERVRLRKTRSAEVELKGARDAWVKAEMAAAEAESTAASLRGAMEQLKKENESLRAQLNKNKTPVHKNLRQWKMEWSEEEEGVEVAAVKGQHLNDISTLDTANLHRFNALGAEDDTHLSVHAPEPPPKASRRLFTSAKSSDKENHQTMNMRRSKCSLCCGPPRPCGAIRRCECGRDNCNKWAHASCLVNGRSVSSCVSHPGTPAPPLPIILCSGVCNNKVHVKSEI